ncbi:transposase InsO family protein [Ancylobacter polymorphus]|uniref:Transposase InsO family protein n=1 Tax=Ancylobacter polymorphus TaxID=223390 RepID=A0ABU0BF84_9HYPH|nr:transposase InsO family protein [Ancylobacter polymorphus]
MIRDARKTETPGRVVAALTFGYWTAMVGREYEDLWQRTLKDIARQEGGKGLTRKHFSKPLAPVRTLRNRIAHHEPILYLDLPKHYYSLLQLTHWLSPVAAQWCRNVSRLLRRTRTTDSRHSYPIAPNRLARNFRTSAPNQIWLADLTYIPTGEGWLYLAGVLDMHTRKLVGWSMRETLHTQIALEALAMAIERQRPAPGLIHHSDRGIQYAAEAYRRALTAAGITPSMSRKGDCWDNAPMESFFHTLKTVRVHHRLYATRAEARRDLFGYIEGFYNSRRLHSALGYISPAEMERRAA